MESDVGAYVSWSRAAMPTPKANSGNITNNHSQKNSSDSSSPIDDRTVKDTAFEVEENHRLVWEEDCSSSNVGSLSDLGFVPSDFDPTPLDKLLSSSTSDQEEEEVEQFYAFRACLDEYSRLIPILVLSDHFLIFLWSCSSFFRTYVGHQKFIRIRFPRTPPLIPNFKNYGILIEKMINWIN